MATHSYIATVQVDFEYDPHEVGYNRARLEALRMVVRPLFDAEGGSTRVVRVVVSDNEGAGTQFELERKQKRNR